MKPFVVTIADLIHRPGARRPETLHGTTAELVVTETVVPAGSALDVVAMIEAVSDGVVVTGTAGTQWSANCRRCLVPIVGEIQADFRELYSEHPIDGETYPIAHDQVDLELVAREAILLDLPLAPLCREECAGLCITCGADRNDGPCSCAPALRDPRWSALDGLIVAEQSEQ